MKPRILVLIDQATRDAFSQLLVVRYLRSCGARVHICNQQTWAASLKRYQPDVFFSSWLEEMVHTLPRIQGQTKLALIDHEGGRLGKDAFVRSFEKGGADKRRLADRASLVFTYGREQKKWLTELGVIASEQIKVTGSPRWDPYMVPSDVKREFIGFTLRSEAFTAQPSRIVENLFAYADMAEKDWLSVGYPRTAQQEDRLWHVAANLRQCFRIMLALRKVSDVPIVVRPGPWEQPQMYDFLTRKIPNLTIDRGMPQHLYVRKAYALVDESSSLGLEAVIAGTPVISTHYMIPHLEQHIGGKDAGLFNAPCKVAFMQPTSVEGVIELINKTIQGARFETADILKYYLADCHSWPRERPSAFQIGDALLNLAAPRPRSWFIPGELTAYKAQLVGRLLFSKEREHLRKYHYLDSTYKHHREVDKVFKRLKAYTALPL